MAAGFFDTASLSNHNHTAVAGDGGQLSNPAFLGVANETGVPANAGDLTGYQFVHALYMVQEN